MLKTCGRLRFGETEVAQRVLRENHGAPNLHWALLWWCGRFQTHDVEAGIDVKHVASYTAAQVTSQKNGGIRDLADFGVASQRRVFLHKIQNLGKVFDATGRDGLDRASGNGVDANFLRAQLGGEITDFGFAEVGTC